MEQGAAERLTALWKSGRDKYRSFFTVLNEVRKEIGDEALAGWCINELSIGISVINTAAGILTKIDADAVKAELAAANKAERDKAKRERAAEERERKYGALKKEQRKLIGKIRAKTPILERARIIVRPIVEQNQIFKARELEKIHGISHVTFEMAMTAERARRETIEEFAGYCNGHKFQE